MNLEQLEAYARRWAKVYTLPMEAGYKGAYDRERDAIYLDRGLNDLQRRCTLAHELSHARHGDRGCGGDRGLVERRADMEAARLLIDPLDYMQCERVCDNPMWLARELDVTPDLVWAYRSWLQDTMPCRFYNESAD